MAANFKMRNNSGKGQFELICSIKANGMIQVNKYKSGATGLTIIIAEVEGPVVNGYFCLATEAHDDDGLPHTLEHLIFLGSENYPYKGVLDLLANRCLASGTNAWTDTDHTCYTMTTAGSEGFLSLMPIYLDHILYPTLKDSGFITEVHHVTEKGEDAGVVYCEMQGRENSGESRTYIAMIRALYPGDCGYKSETGGIMKNLRESTTNEKVRQYHKDFYRPENLTLIIVGQVQDDDVFSALASVEEKIISKGDRGPFTRPWQSPVCTLPGSVELDIPYPCDEEDNGMVYIAWRGPYSIKERYETNAFSILLKYLTDTSVSPLKKAFVEIDDPYASDVDYSLSEHSQSMMYLSFENVPKDKVKSVKGHLTQVLQAMVKGDEKLDMSRLRTVIHRQILENLSDLENSPHETLATMIIGDVLYGNTERDLYQSLNQVESLRNMENEVEDFWIKLIRQYLVDAPSVTICGIPSIEEQKSMTLEEKNRITSQRDALGSSGLKDNGEILQKATAENNIPPPPEMLTSVAIPSTSSIKFHPIERYTSFTQEQHNHFNLKSIPHHIQLDDVHTNFVYMYVLMDTSTVRREMRPYLPLLLESLLKLPIERHELVPYEKIVAELETDTVSATTAIGLDTSSQFNCGLYSQTAVISLLLEPEKYGKGILWIRELLYQTVFTAERLKIISTKIMNDVAQVKRQGNRVVRDLMRGLWYDKDSNHFATSMMRQHQFLNKLVEKLDSSENQKDVINEINEVRHQITQPGHIVIHIATNVETLLHSTVDPITLWGKYLPCECSATRGNFPIIPDWTMMTPQVEEFSESCVVGMGCLESSFFYQTTRTINDYNDPDLSPLLVFLQYLTQLEGPLWKQVRGLGLAYGYTMIPRPNEGLLYLTFYRATNCVLAYKQVKNIIDQHLSDGSKWDQSLFESARTSLMFEIIEREKCVSDVVTQSILSYFRKVTKNYNKNLVQLISRVTTDDLNRVGQKYVAPLFDPKRSKTCIVCHPSKTDEIARDFSEFNLQLKTYQSLEESFLNKW